MSAKAARAGKKATTSSSPATSRQNTSSPRFSSNVTCAPPTTPPTMPTPPTLTTPEGTHDQPDGRADPRVPVPRLAHAPPHRPPRLHLSVVRRDGRTGRQVGTVAGPQGR